MPIACEAMAKTYHCAIEVRAYELDSFQHVNHANYLNYLEFARWKLLADEKITLKDFVAWKMWPVISRIEIDYVKPAFAGDQLDVRSRIIDHGKTNFVIEQQIFRGDKVVIKAQVQSVLVNENGRPTALPKELERLWSEKDAGGGI